MTPDQKLLVRHTWDTILPVSSQAADLFYSRLFEQYPEVKPYFKGDLQQQGQKLMTMINTAVMSVDNINLLVEPLEKMGARHAHYGVKEDDYDKVGDALLWTLEKALGPAFTPKVKQAWGAIYSTAANIMKQGAANSLQAA
jgi:hemoglobin-like flavoprotein